MSLPWCAPIWRAAPKSSAHAHVAVDGEHEAPAREALRGLDPRLRRARALDRRLGSGAALGCGSGVAVAAGAGVAAGSAPSTASASTPATITVVPDAKPATARVRRTRSPSPSRLTVTRAPPDDQLCSPLAVPALPAVQHQARDRAAVADAAVLRRRGAADALGGHEAAEQRDDARPWPMRGRRPGRRRATPARSRGRRRSPCRTAPRRRSRRGVAPAAANGGAADDPEVAGGHVRLGDGTRRRLRGRGGHEQQRHERGGCERGDPQAHRTSLTNGASLSGVEAASPSRELSGEKAQRIIDAMRASVGAARRDRLDVRPRRARGRRLARAAALLLRHQGAAARRGRAARLRPADGAHVRDGRERRRRRRAARRARAVAERDDRRVARVLRDPARAAHARAAQRGDRHRARRAAPARARAPRRAARDRRATRA